MTSPNLEKVVLQAVSSNNKQMSFRQSIIVRGNESSDDSSVLHLAPGWERRVALIWHFRL